MSVTWSGRVFGRVLHVESKHRTRASLCYLSNIDIFQYVTQNSTSYKTKHAPLYHSRTYSNEYIGIGSTYMYKGHFFRTAFIKALEAQSKEHQTTNLKVVSSSPTVGKNFSFCILSLSTCSWQFDWSHLNESMTLIWGNMCIERMIIWKWRRY